MHTSHELWAVATEHARRHQREKERRLSLAARIAALQQEEEDALRQEEENRMIAEQNEKAAKTQLFTEQRTERQQVFRSSITDHTIRGVREAADGNQILKDAINSITEDQDDDTVYQVFRAALLSELASNGKDFLKDLARKISSQTSIEDDRILKEYAAGTQNLGNNPIRQDSQDNSDIMKFVLPESANQNGDTNTLVGIRSSEGGEASDPVSSGAARPSHTTRLGTSLSNASAASPSLISASPEMSRRFVVKTEMTQLPTLNSIERPSLMDIEGLNDINLRQDNENTPQFNLMPEDLDDYGERTGVHSRTTPQVLAKDLEVDLGTKKRMREESTNSRASLASTAPALKRTRKRSSKFSRTMIQFEDRLVFLVNQNLPVPPEFCCAKCDNQVSNGSLGPCAHLYHNKCLAALRKEDDNVDSEGPRCALKSCQSVLSAKGCVVVKKEQLDELRVRFHPGFGKHGVSNDQDELLDIDIEAENEDE